MSILTERCGDLHLKDFYQVTVALIGHNLSNDMFYPQHHNDLKQHMLKDFIWGYNDRKKDAQGNPLMYNNDLQVIADIEQTIKNLNIDDFNPKRPTALLMDTLNSFVRPEIQSEVRITSERISMWDHKVSKYLDARAISIRYKKFNILKVYIRKIIL